LEMDDLDYLEELLALEEGGGSVVIKEEEH
jgi:hypothetical protein